MTASVIFFYDHHVVEAVRRLLQVNAVRLYKDGVLELRSSCFREVREDGNRGNFCEGQDMHRDGRDGCTYHQRDGTKGVQLYFALTEFKPATTSLAMRTRDGEVFLDMNPGDAMFMDPRQWHGSWVNSSSELDWARSSLYGRFVEDGAILSEIDVCVRDHLQDLLNSPSKALCSHNVTPGDFLKGPCFPRLPVDFHEFAERMAPEWPKQFLCIDRKSIPWPEERRE